MEAAGGLGAIQVFVLETNQKDVGDVRAGSTSVCGLFWFITTLTEVTFISSVKMLSCIFVNISLKVQCDELGEKNNNHCVILE